MSVGLCVWGVSRSLLTPPPLSYFNLNPLLRVIPQNTFAGLTKLKEVYVPVWDNDDLD